MAHHRATLRQTLRKSLQKISTHEGFIVLLLHVLKHGVLRAFHHIDHHITIQQLWNDSIELQKAIGWKAFIKGFWTDKWLDLHTLHFKYKASPLSASTWAIKPSN